MGELRWTLLGLGILAICAIWWWTVRRSGQAPGNAELRESTAMPVHTFGPTGGESLLSEKRPHVGDTRDWSVSPLEPLSIRTTELQRVPALDRPMTSNVEPLDLPVELDAPPLATDEELTLEPAAEPVLADAPPLTAMSPPTAPTPAATPPPIATRPMGSPTPLPKLRAATENSDRLAAVAPQIPNTSERQRIVTVRVCAVGDALWSGSALMAALEVYGLAYGRYQVYHRKHSDGRSIFCVASLIEPGTFDIARMADEEFRGVTLFAVLPGPLEPLQTVDALLTTARELARELSGAVQDAKGLPFSPQRAAALREDVVRFQEFSR